MLSEVFNQEKTESIEKRTGVHRLSSLKRAPFDAFVYANRIPEAAEPFDSKSMAQEGANFRWTFDVEGTYDYYSRTHEFLGMVGRIVVGQPGGPAEKTPGYGNREGRTVMYRKPRALLEYLKAEDIVQQKRVSCPLELVEHPFPWR